MTSELDAYRRNADANQEKLRHKLKQLESMLGSVSIEMLENILFDNLNPEITRRTLNSAQENPVIDMTLGHEYHIEGLVIAGHGRHDRARQLRIYCGTTAPVVPEDSWPDHPIRDDSTDATLHAYGLVNIEDLADEIASNAAQLRSVSIVAAEQSTDDPTMPDQTAQAAALARQLHQRGVTGLSLPTEHLRTDAARELLDNTVEDIALQTGQTQAARSPLRLLGALLQRR